MTATRHRAVAAPVHAVDLMTLEGSAIFGAQWKTREAKIVEVPAIPDAMPEFTTTYDIDPHAGERGFDDAAWPTIAPTELEAPSAAAAGCRSSGFARA